MADRKALAVDLKKLISVAKTKTLKDENGQPLRTKESGLSFGYAVGSKEDIFLIDRKLTAQKLGQQAKKESGSSKYTFGKIEVVSTILHLTDERGLPSFAKTVKTYLKSLGLSYNVRVTDPAGKELSSDVEALPEDVEDAAAAVPPPPPPPPQVPPKAAGASVQELAARIKALQPIIAGLSGPKGEKMQKILSGAIGQLKTNQPALAEKSVVALEGALQGAAPQGAAPAAAAAAGPDLRALAARTKALKEVVAGMSGPNADRLTKAIGQVAANLKAGKLTEADASLGQIEAAVNAAARPDEGETGETSPQERQWADTQARLQPLVDKAMQDKRGDLAAINRAFNFAKQQAAGRDFARALAAAARTEELLAAAEGASGTAAAAEARASIPVDVVPFVESRQTWEGTRKDLHKQLQGLKSAIDTTTSQIEGLEHVASKTASMFNHLTDLDDSLENTLEQLVETPDGTVRESLKSRARTIIQGYRTLLDTPFFQAVDDNGFVKTDIRMSALTSLQKVSAALEAKT